MKHIYRNKKKLGFSVIEVMAAITIITIGLVGILALAEQNIKVGNYNKNELIASQLAQEGLELVRNRRDENWLTAGYHWKFGAGTGTGSDIVQDGSYTIDAFSALASDNVDGIDDNDANLSVQADGFYGHGWGGSSIFNRIINVVDNDGDYIEVKSTVRWKERGRTHDYIASTLLYDWR